MRTRARLRAFAVARALPVIALLVVATTSGGLAEESHTPGSEPSWLPEQDGRVTDAAGILSGEFERSLTDELKSYEERTTHQIAVLTVEDLRGEPLKSLSLRVANTWGIGREEFDNGLLLSIAPNERQVRIEVGKGLEKAIPDRVARSILNESLIPALNEGDYERAVWNGTNRLMEAASALKVGSPSEPGSIAELLTERDAYDGDLVVVDGALASIASDPTRTGRGELKWILHIDDGTDSLRIAAPFEDVLSLRTGLRIREGDRLQARGVFRKAASAPQSATPLPELDATAEGLRLVSRDNANEDASLFGPTPEAVPTARVETPWSRMVGVASIVAGGAAILGLVIGRRRPSLPQPRMTARGPVLRDVRGDSSSHVTVDVAIRCPRGQRVALSDVVLLHDGEQVVKAQSTRIPGTDAPLTFPFVPASSSVALECDFPVPRQDAALEGARVILEDIANDRLLSANVLSASASKQKPSLSSIAIAAFPLLIATVTQPALAGESGRTCQQGPDGSALSAVSFCLVSFQRGDAVELHIPMEPPSPATGAILGPPEGADAGANSGRFAVKDKNGRPHVFSRQTIEAEDDRFPVATFRVSNEGSSAVSISPDVISFRAKWVGDVGFVGVGLDGFLVLKRSEAERTLAADTEAVVKPGKERTLRYLIAESEQPLTWSVDRESWNRLERADSEP